MLLSVATSEFMSFIKTSGRAADTIKNYRSCFSLLIQYMGDPDISEITLENTMEFMRWLSMRPGRDGPCNKITISTRMRSIRMFFKWLSIYKDVRYFDWSLIIVPTSDYRRTSYLTKEEFYKIVGCINCRTFEGVRLRAMIETYMSTGSRLSGVLNLKISDINFEKKEATIRSKGGEYMLVYLNNRSILWIKRYLERRVDNCPYLWVSRKNSHGIHRLNSNSFSYQIHELEKLSAVGKNWSCHTLRHSYATQILQNGANIRVVQELLGHKSLDSTMIYTHVSNIDLKNAHNKYLKI